MAGEIFFQNVIFSKFVLPFLLIFFIVFAVLEKTKVLGENKQISALVAFVIGLIFVGVAYPKEVVGNLILFLSVALVVLFVVLILWGFLAGDRAEFSNLPNGIKVVAGIFLFVVLVVGVVWSTGVDLGFVDFLFYQPWSESFWTNAIFVVLIGAALAFIVRSPK
ncbi:MAG: hypothetical protein WDZ77_00970 [Candidatus Pacearchaeota archaeon]